MVDDHQIVIDGLRAMLSTRSDDIEVVAATTDPSDAKRLVMELSPDIAILDVRMRSMSGLELCAELRRIAPETKVVLLTVYDDEQYLFEALRSGASGYLTKQIDRDELLAQLQKVREGDTVVDPGLAGQVALSAARLNRGEFWAGAALGLTQRESQVLELMVRGQQNKAIAERLILGEETVKTHVKSIYRKLDVSDRSQAVARALRERIFL